MTDFLIILVGLAQCYLIILAIRLLNCIDKFNALIQLGNQLSETTERLKTAIENQTKGK